MANITLDENGKISDNDELYKILDECYDNDEYDNIIAAVLSVPEEQRSVKLRFRLIGALNNKKDFENSRNELQKILPDCKTPAEIARYFYMQGYILFINDKELAALSFYEAGINADPENTSGLDLADEAKECREYVDKDLKELAELAKQVCGDIDKRCAEKTEKEKISDGAFTVLMGLIPALRQLPAVGRGLGLDDFFQKFEGKDRDVIAQWLDTLFGIKDKESFIKFYQTAQGCNISGMYADVDAFLSGKPRFDLKTLRGDAQRAFHNTCMFTEPVREFLPKAGVLGWDLSEKIGFSRLAYSVDVLEKNDYLGSMVAIKKAALDFFPSTAEFLKSLVIGSALYTFASSEWDIKGAITMMKRSRDVMLHCELPDAEWA